jgi:hypothetical protein
VKRPKREVLVAAALLGIMVKRGWIEGPWKVDLDLALDTLRGDGRGINIDVDTAVEYTVALISKAQGVAQQRAGIEVDETVEREEDVRQITVFAYAELMEAIGR